MTWMPNSNEFLAAYLEFPKKVFGAKFIPYYSLQVQPWRKYTKIVSKDLSKEGQYQMITVLIQLIISHTLRRLYESLCNQKSKNFEWVVVDDGSTDKTQALLSGFAKSALFPIQIISQPNSGKHAAVNNGVSCSSDWIFIVDSDDALTPGAIGTIEVINSFRLG